MNILYLNHYAGSPHHGMEYRPYYLSREWVAQGHAVRLVACSYSHVRAQQPSDGGEFLHPRSEWIDGIEYLWYPGPGYQGNGLGRVKNIWAFLSQVWRDAHKIVSEFRPDMVIASSTYPMDIWVAKRIARMSEAKLVFEVHDLWPLSPIELGGMSPFHPFIQLCQFAENTAYREADIVVSMLPNVHDHMSNHGLDLNKLHIIPNGIALDDWQGEQQVIADDLATHIAIKHSHGNFVVGYTGFFGVQNALDALLNTAVLLRNHPVCFVIVGDGHEKIRLTQRVELDGLDNVKIFPSIPKSQIPSLLKLFDVAYLGAPKSPIYRFGVSPNKLLDYMMAEVPVIYAIEAGNDLVAEANCGLSVRADSPSSIAEAIMLFTQFDVEKRRGMGRNGRQFVIDNLTYNVLARRFLDVMNNGDASC